MKTIAITIVCFIFLGFACRGMKEFFHPEPDQIIPGEIKLTMLPDSVYRGLATCGPVKVILDVEVIDHSISSKTILLAIETALDNSTQTE